MTGRTILGVEQTRLLGMNGRDLAWRRVADVQVKEAQNEQQRNRADAQGRLQGHGDGAEDRQDEFPPADFAQKVRDHLDLLVN